jgi:adenylate kinase
MMTKTPERRDARGEQHVEESIDAVADESPLEIEADTEDADVAGIIHLDIVLLGPPGAGKGTQADALARRLALAHIDEINLIRRNVELGTALGTLARSYLERGNRVPEDLTEAMVEERLGAPDTVHGFVLDGFPHALEQAEVLDHVVRAMNRRIAGAMLINLPDEEIHARLAGRLVCSRCARPYHLQFAKPREKRICDDCKVPLVQREDDTPAGIAARLQNYRRQTLPVVDYYRESGLLIEIDGRGDPDDVLRRTLAAATSLIGPSPLH